jgi:hypothetical protein
MRKYLALAIAGALSIGVVSFASADESVQTEEAKVKPTKFSKKKHKPVTLINTITTVNDPATGQPPSANRTVLDLPKQMRFNTKNTPKCKTDVAGLAAAGTTDDAIKACGKKSVVTDAKGSPAEVTVGDPINIVLDIQVTGFNEDGKKLILFAKPTGSAAGIPASILLGKLKKASKIKGRPAEAKNTKPYGESLDVTIPPLAAGAISLFKVKIPKSANYVQAKCKPKKMQWQATTFFDDGSTTTDTDTQKCKPKK